jgi:spore maturation protein CgeB
MNLVIFGLTISSTWANGHATLWRGLCRALARRGSRVVFFEHDVPYYAAHRDMPRPEGCDLRLYSSWAEALPDARREVRGADVAIVTSYCPDAVAAAALVCDSAAVRVFYDMDTGVTLKQLEQGRRVFYVPPEGLGGFDLVLSFTGGAALDLLQRRLGARAVAPLYGCVDPHVHTPAPPRAARAILSYLGTYAADRQDRLQRLFLEPARRLPAYRFLLAGSQYPHDFPWAPNIFYVPHVPASAHAAFFADSKLTVNVTRAAMAELGYCPSPRLFEAAACRTAALSDRWEGLERFFEPGTEILVADNAEGAVAALDRDDREIQRIAQAAYERTLAEHTADARAVDLEQTLSRVSGSAPAPVQCESL